MHFSLGFVRSWEDGVAAGVGTTAPLSYLCMAPVHKQHTVNFAIIFTSLKIRCIFSKKDWINVISLSTTRNEFGTTVSQYLHLPIPGRSRFYITLLVRERVFKWRHKKVSRFSWNTSFIYPFNKKILSLEWSSLPNIFLYFKEELEQSMKPDDLKKNELEHGKILVNWLSREIEMDYTGRWYGW